MFPLILAVAPRAYKAAINFVFFARYKNDNNTESPPGEIQRPIRTAVWRDDAAITWASHLG
jgi:hypothetical protein